MVVRDDVAIRRDNDSTTQAVFHARSLPLSAELRALRTLWTKKRSKEPLDFVLLIIGHLLLLHARSHCHVHHGWRHVRGQGLHGLVKRADSAHAAVIKCCSCRCGHSACCVCRRRFKDFVAPKRSRQHQCQRCCQRSPFQERFPLFYKSLHCSLHLLKIHCRMSFVLQCLSFSL